MRKKLIGTMLVLAFLICAAVIVHIVPGNKGNISHVNRVIGYSALYSEETIGKIFGMIEKEFAAEFEGCTLTELRYDDEVESRYGYETYQYYVENNRELIIVLSSFYTDEKGVSSRFNPNTAYTDWQWYLVRNADRKSWEILKSEKASACIYQSDHVTVELLDDPAEEAAGGQGAQSVQSISMSNSASSSGQEYVLMTRERAFGKNTILLKGTISNIRDVAVTYTTSMDSKTTDELAIFDVEVEEVLYCSTASLPERSKVSVGIPYTMREKAPGVPRLAEGAEYLVFCYATADVEKDPMEMAGYVDCWLSDPRHLLLEKVGEEYIISDFLQEELKSTAAHPDQIGSRIACDVLEAQLAAWMEEYHTQ